MSTAAKGFVQPASEVLHDISAYEEVQNLKEVRDFVHFPSEIMDFPSILEDFSDVSPFL